MAENQNSNHGIFDALSRFFSPEHGAAAKKSPEAPDFAAMHGSFNQALQRLNSKIEELQREKENARGPSTATAAHAEEKLRRTALLHAAMRGDILALHRQMQTGIDAAELERLAAFMKATGEEAASGNKSLEVMPRCRHGILLRLQREAGLLAWDELERRCGAAGVVWPETARRDPLDTPEEFEALRQNKYRENREAFLDDDIARSGQLLLGIEKAWKSDYPERGTPLWQQLALDGVGSALRARLLQHFYARLLQLREAILARAASQVGPDLEELNRTVGVGVVSLQDAHRVAASSYRILDEVIPEIAWSMIRDEDATATPPPQ